MGAQIIQVCVRGGAGSFAVCCSRGRFSSASPERLSRCLKAGTLGTLLSQSAFRAGALSVSLPVIDTLEPVSAVVIGAFVFGERLAASPGQLAAQLAGGAVAVAGIAALSRSSVAAMEAGPEDPASRGAGHALQAPPRP